VKVLARALVLLLLAALPAGSRAARLPQYVVFTNVAIVNLEAGVVEPDMTVVIRDGRIEAIARRGLIQLSRNVRVINAKGKYLMPGLWDMHLHLAIRPEAELSPQVILPLLVAHGVVGTRDMGSDFARIQAMRKEIAGEKIPGPAILSPGPFVDGPQPADATVVPVANAAEARQAARALKARGVDFIKAQAGLSREAFLALADEARRAGIPIAGHVPEAVSAREVSDAGQKSIEHVSPALPGDAGILLAVSSREDELRKELLFLRAAEAEPGSSRKELRAHQRALQVALLDSYSPEKAATLFRRMAENKTYVVPTLIWSQSYRPPDATKLGDGVPLEFVPAAMRERWLARRAAYQEVVTEEDSALNRRMAEKSLQLVQAMHRARVPLLAGTDSLDAFVLPGLSLHQELELLVQAGLPPLEALRTATLNAARFLGREKEMGSVEKGMLGDVVLLDANPLIDIRNTRRIAGLVLRGQYYSRRDLDEMLEGVRKNASTN